MPDRTGSYGDGIALDPRELAAGLESAPKEFREQLSAGFRLLLALDAQSLARAVREVAREFTVSPPDPDSLARLVDAPRDDAIRMATALSVLVVGASAIGIQKALAEFVPSGILDSDEANKLAAAIGPAYAEQQAAIKR